MNFEKVFLSIVFPLAYLVSVIFLSQGIAGGLIVVMSIPSFAAVILILIEFKSLKALFKPFSYKISFKSLCFSILFPIIIISLCGFLALTVFKGHLLENSHYALTAILKLILMSIILFIIGLLEEYGWRSYLLPKLINKHSLKKANIIMGAIWMLYRLPALIILNLHHGMTKAIPYVLLQSAAIFALNYAFTYLYTLSKNVILPSIMYILWSNLNIAVLGYPFRSTSYGFIIGRVQLINAECLLGLIFLTVFAIYAHRKFLKA